MRRKRRDEWEGLREIPAFKGLYPGFLQKTEKKHMISDPGKWNRPG